MTMACLVLASGLSRRFGEDDKLLADLKGQALLAYCLDAAKSVTFDGYFVVTPENTPRGRLAKTAGFDIAHNPEPEAGMGASLSLGAEYIIDKGFDSACILLGDMPFVTSGFVIKLVKSSLSFDIVFSRNNNRDMPPAVFRHHALTSLTHLRGDQGAKSLDLTQFKVSHIELPNEMARDMDRPDDFEV